MTMKVCKTQVVISTYFNALLPLRFVLGLIDFDLMVFSDWWTWPTKNYRVCDLVLFQKRRAASQRKNNHIACNYLLVHISPNILYIYMAHCETVKHKLEAKISDFKAEM